MRRVDRWQPDGARAFDGVRRKSKLVTFLSMKFLQNPINFVSTQTLDSAGYDSALNLCFCLNLGKYGIFFCKVRHAN